MWCHLLQVHGQLLWLHRTPSDPSAAAVSVYELNAAVLNSLQVHGQLLCRRRRCCGCTTPLMSQTPRQYVHMYPAGLSCPLLQVHGQLLQARALLRVHRTAFASAAAATLAAAEPIIRCCRETAGSLNLSA